MRTVVKSVIRSLSASASGCAMNRDLHNRGGFVENRKRNQLSEVFINGATEMQLTPKSEYKVNSLSPSYNLNNVEASSFERLLDRECEYYPDNSNRGDYSILNMKLRSIMREQNVSSIDVKNNLKTIRFINNFVFGANPNVFLTTCNLLQRLLDKKAVKKDLMPFIITATYDIATEHITGKALPRDQIILLLYLSKVPVNHIEDISRMKQLLVQKLNNDLKSVLITDYLKILLKVDVDQEFHTLSDTYKHLVDISSVLATSCELTHFTLSCQAISLVTLAARHMSLSDSFKSNYSSTIDKFPIIFLSPVRLNQFSKSANIPDESIKHCIESLVRFYCQYYTKADKIVPHVMLPSQKKKSIAVLPTIEEGNEHEASFNATSLNVTDLIDKLDKVSSNMNFSLNGKQKQRRKQTKKKLCRQLKKCRKFQFDVKQKVAIAVDEDSAFSFSSNETSVSLSSWVV